MTRLKPGDPFPHWQNQTTLERALACASMLHVHQFMSDRERQSVQRRLDKWLDKWFEDDGDELRKQEPKPRQLRPVGPSRRAGKV